MVLEGNIDCKGVARGRCTECQQCDQFLIRDHDIKCSYCGHPPASHLNLEEQPTKQGYEVELTPFPDNTASEPGTISVKARLFPGYADPTKVQSVGCCLIIIIMVLIFITFGLIMLIILPIIIVAMMCIVCFNLSNPNDITLTFDNDKQTLTGPVYGTIPYSKIAFSTYFKNPATVFFEIRLSNIEYVEKRNCFLKCFTDDINPNEDPKYVILPLNSNAIQLKEIVESLAAFTKIPYEPPPVAWDTIQILVNTELARRAARNRRHHH